MQSLITQLRYTLIRISRQAHFHKPLHYQAIPHYIKPNFIDIHDFALRNYAEVKESLKNKQFEISYQVLICSPSDFHKDQKMQKAVAVLPIAQFKFTKRQLERFKILVGQRYKDGAKQVKISCHMFDNYDANFEKLNEQIFEVLIEAKRAY